MAVKLRTGVCITALIPTLIACATTSRPVPEYSHRMSRADEALAIEQAKHHPIAIPRVRPLYPEQSPPPLPDRERAAPTGAPPPPPAYADTPGNYDAPPSSMGAPLGPSTYYSDGPVYAAPPGYGLGYRISPGSYGWRSQWFSSPRDGYYLSPQPRPWRSDGWTYPSGSWGRGYHNEYRLAPYSGRPHVSFGFGQHSGFSDHGGRAAAIHGSVSAPRSGRTVIRTRR